MRFVKFHLNVDNRVGYFRVDRIAVVFQGERGTTHVALLNGVDGEEWQIRETLDEAMRRIEEAMKD